MSVQLLGPQRYNTVAESDMGLMPHVQNCQFVVKEKRERGLCTCDHHRGW